MNLSHCVVHEIVKEAGESSAEAQYSQTLMPVSDEIEALVKQMSKRFSGNRIVQARFNKSPGKLFSQKLDSYLSNKNSTTFLSYSQEIVGHLESIIQGKVAAKGGYILICEFEETADQAIFLIRNTLGNIFKKTASGFEVDQVLHLDTEHLAMACKIETEAYQEEQNSYLSLSHKTENEVSDYFSDWIGIEDAWDSKTMTTQLQDLLETVEMPINEETGELASRAQTYERAYEHIRASPAKVVDIHELSQELYGSPAYLEDHAKEQGLEIESNFKAHTPALKSMVMMQIKTESIDLKFPRTALEDGLIYTEGEGAELKIVIASPELVNQLLNKE